MFWHHTRLATSSCLTRSRSTLWGSSKVSDSEIFLLTVQKMFWLEPLLLRRTKNDLMFLFNLVNKDGYIDCPGLLKIIIGSTVQRGKHSRSAFQGRFRPTNNYGTLSTVESLNLSEVAVPWLPVWTSSIWLPCIIQKVSICGTPPSVGFVPAWVMVLCPVISCHFVLKYKVY